MPLKESARQCKAIAKKTGKRCCNPAVNEYSVCRLHGAGNKSNPNSNANLKHGRYSKLKREALRSLIEEYEKDPDPLNILPELAAARALFQDFIDRYDEWRDAIIAWHQSYQAGMRPISKEKADSLVETIDAYSELIAHEDDLTERQQKNLQQAKEFCESLKKGSEGKPTQVLDITDAYRIVSEITKIVERIEKIRSANAISRPDLIRVMTEMSRVVQAHVADTDVLEKIKTGWLTIRV